MTTDAEALQVCLLSISSVCIYNVLDC
ncbi:hypothetical protein NC651_027044 [Populus alba x Populus x berolinensis]|nr:hypothetical protein NC651_027044 [Populus alba x Populus x berolinensis]